MLKYEDDFKVAMTRRHKRLPIIFFKLYVSITYQIIYTCFYYWLKLHRMKKYTTTMDAHKWCHFGRHVWCGWHRPILYERNTPTLESWFKDIWYQFVDRHTRWCQGEDFYLRLWKYCDTENWVYLYIVLCASLGGKRRHNGKCFLSLCSVHCIGRNYLWSLE